MDSTKKVTFAAIPVVNYNRSLGFMAGAMVSAYYKLDRSDTISPSSSTMVFGMYSTSKTYMVMGMQKLYLNEDKWRADLIFGSGVFFFQFFKEFSGFVNQDGVWVDYSTEATFTIADVKRRVFKNLYLGIRTELMNTQTTFGVRNPITGNDLTSEARMNSLGYNFLFDSRDDVNFPTKGYYVQFKNGFVREDFNATENFDNFELAFNTFWDINKNAKSVLVSRVFADIAAGEVPFQGQNMIGGDDLRGYSEGRFRADQVYAVQSELRQNVYKKFGMIGFFGIGAAVDKIKDLGEAVILPSAGIGFRYLMIPDEKINIGVDFGVGKDDWSMVFRIGETFGR